MEALRNLIRNVLVAPCHCKPYIGCPSRLWNHWRWCVFFLTPNKELRSAALSSMGRPGDPDNRGRRRGEGPRKALMPRPGQGPFSWSWRLASAKPFIHPFKTSPEPLLNAAQGLGTQRGVGWGLCSPASHGWGQPTGLNQQQEQQQKSSTAA